MQIDGNGAAKKEYIYALVDPTTEDPFYLGRSVLSSEGTYYEPVDPGVDVETKIAKKVFEIGQRNKAPLFVILEETVNGEQSHREWLEYWVSEGHPLVNEMPAPEKAKTKRLTIDIDADLHVALKKRAFNEGTSVADLARKQFKEWTEQRDSRKAQ